MRRCLPLLFAVIPVVLLLGLPNAYGLEQASVDQYLVHLKKLQALVGSCAAKASACDAGAVGNDDQVQMQGLGVGANVNSFEARYDWLRDALKSAHSAEDKDRAGQMQAAAGRLDDALREASGKGATQADIAAARRHADAILGNAEFVTVKEDSIWERLWARIAMWLDSLFNNVAQFGKRSPWIGPVMEWGLIALALLGLVVWAMRVFQRQRLTVRVEAARHIEPWEEAARNWRAQAEERATASDWREAVHCLYWASIAVLEGRRVWAPNRSRTPREYVRLLESGSTRWTLLRQQTQGFERVWYGFHDAAKPDYERALELHEGLRSA